MAYAAAVRDSLEGKAKGIAAWFKHPATIASANDLDLSDKKANVFAISGTTQINGIKMTGAVAGTPVLLQFAGALVVNHNGSPTSGYGKIYTASGADVTTSSTRVLLLVYDGTDWREPGLQVVSPTAGLKFNGAEGAFDGSNPTSIAHGLTTCTSVTATLKLAVSPGTDGCIITANINGANVDYYLWKVTAAGDATLVASTAVTGFYWQAMGT